MSNTLVAFFAYLIDKYFGEFRYIKHPVIYMGELIDFFEVKYFKDSIIRGFLLVLFVIGVVAFFSFSIYFFLDEVGGYIGLVLSSLIASAFLANKMLYDSVSNILKCEDKKSAISMLVSRDTDKMDESDIYKASIETYAENLNDGVIAPLFYLVLFNLPAIMIYKAVNTMDSMVGYRDEKYENYGKVAAKLDDILNYVPSRITAVIIMLLFKYRPVLAFYKDGQKHDSPNAGHPITAMALAIGVKLGGDTFYFNKLKKKPHFGDGKIQIDSNDLKKALSIKPKLDFIVLSLLAFIYLMIG